MQTLPEPSFIPLAPSAPGAPKERPDFRVTVASQPANAQPFHALGHKAPVTASPAAANAEPRVTLRRENDRITAIILECACGQTHELTCVYDEPAVVAPVAPAVSVPPPTPAPATTSPPPAAVPAVATPTAKSKDKAPARKARR